MTIRGRVKPLDTNLSTLVGICAHLKTDSRLAPLVEAVQRLARDQDAFNKGLFDSHEGDPVAHAQTHQPTGADRFIHGIHHAPDGLDPLPYAAPSGVQFAAEPAEGSATTVPRSDHVHSRPPVDTMGSVLGLRSLGDDVRHLARKWSWQQVYAHERFR